ncbi:hypothetical protein MSAN_00908400 [Mycena sanguinolenta]|uniref:Uncharacterized protein n=1 Tax=Mycena sanguinolenta TaxID=230812 RepID=A0A8H6YWI6_9AGAR|nr:hypothetical protein MSAN_00908400 [Mycena sanguinolenta]
MYRTFAISGRSPVAYYGLGTVLLLGFPVQVFGIVYHRLPETTGGECVAIFCLPLASFDFQPMLGVKEKYSRRASPIGISYYSAHMGYDVIACATGTFYLILTSRFQGTFNMTKFIRRVLRHGLLYFIVVFVANLWVVLEFEEVLKTGVGSTLPLAVVLIAAQHLILGLQSPTREPSTVEDFSRTPLSGQSARRSTVFRKRSPITSVDDDETQDGVFVLTETYTEPPKRDWRSAGSSVPDRTDDKAPTVSFART